MYNVVILMCFPVGLASKALTEDQDNRGLGVKVDKDIEQDHQGVGHGVHTVDT